MTNDMTTGRPLPLLVKFAVPLTLGNILQQLYNVADSSCSSCTMWRIR